MVEGTADNMYFQQACVLLKIIICKWRTYKVALYAKITLGNFKCISKIHQVATPTKKNTRTCWSVSQQTEGKQRSLLFYLCFYLFIKRGYWWIYYNKIRQRDHWHDKTIRQQREGITPTSHLKALVLCTVVIWAWIHCHEKNPGMKSYATSAEY